MANYCMECGESLLAKAKFCPNCGTTVAIESQPSQQEDTNELSSAENEQIPLATDSSTENVPDPTIVSPSVAPSEKIENTEQTSKLALAIIIFVSLFSCTLFFAATLYLAGEMLEIESWFGGGLVILVGMLIGGVIGWFIGQKITGTVVNPITTKRLAIIFVFMAAGFVIGFVIGGTLYDESCPNSWSCTDSAFSTLYFGIPSILSFFGALFGAAIARVRIKPDQAADLEKT